MKVRAGITAPAWVIRIVVVSQLSAISNGPYTGAISSDLS